MKHCAAFSAAALLNLACVVDIQIPICSSPVSWTPTKPMGAASFSMMIYGQQRKRFAESMSGRVRASESSSCCWTVAALRDNLVGCSVVCSTWNIRRRGIEHDNEVDVIGHHRPCSTHCTIVERCSALNIILAVDHDADLQLRRFVSANSATVMLIFPYSAKQRCRMLNFDPRI
jgi:hypothetical protein